VPDAQVPAQLLRLPQLLPQKTTSTPTVASATTRPRNGCIALSMKRLLLPGGESSSEGWKMPQLLLTTSALNGGVGPLRPMFSRYWNGSVAAATVPVV